MPQRFLRPGITNSDRFNACSMHAQSLFVRLLTRVDDFGRYDGRFAVIAGELFSVWNQHHPEDQIGPQEVAGFCRELQQASLVDFYEAEGKQCLQVLQWQDRVRSGVREKWPANQKLQQVAASCSKILQNPAPRARVEGEGEVRTAKAYGEGEGGVGETSRSATVGAEASGSETLAESSALGGTSSETAPSGVVTPDEGVRSATGESDAFSGTRYQTAWIDTPEEAVSACMSIGAPEDFIRYVHADWHCRGGKDGAGQAVQFVTYAKKRWNREGKSWKNGTHRGNPKAKSKAKVAW